MLDSVRLRVREASRSWALLILGMIVCVLLLQLLLSISSYLFESIVYLSKVRGELGIDLVGDIVVNVCPSGWYPDGGMLFWELAVGGLFEC